VIDRMQEDVTAGGVAYDAIFDTVGKSSFGRAKRVLKPGGVYLTTVPSLGIMMRKGRADAEGRRADILFTGLRPDAEKLADLELMAELVAGGKLRAVIDRTYPLAEMADAHRYVQTGRKVGSVVVEV
jgi:NADPH:quinone reductase-like Zn-dependent oxidoreductase